MYIVLKALADLIFITEIPWRLHWRKMLLGYFRCDILSHYLLSQWFLISFILQVLVDKGVLIDEMKLYGQTEVDEAIDESFSEFSELETVISKVLISRWFDTFHFYLSLSLQKQSSYALALYLLWLIYHAQKQL